MAGLQLNDFFVCFCIRIDGAKNNTAEWGVKVPGGAAWRYSGVSESHHHPAVWTWCGHPEAEAVLQQWPEGESR